ncbi:ARMT1-like domain-containing protein [Anaerofustis sp.]|uniref:damage-control phosphatase ARMT1 family protein n=1 Tax=Anaerofustis sp. TaxID=1872517 RepID=UPI0025B7D53D|nr:ARMT1-like domain-containing protein [Anaerofustis sp.]
MANCEACLECNRKRYTKIAEKFIPEEKREQYLKEVSDAVREAPYQEMESAWERITRRYLKTDNIHQEAREKFQKCILDMKDDIESMLDESDDVINDAIKFAIAGNVIDFSTMPNLTFDELKEIINNVKDFKFDEELYAKFISELEDSKEIVILLDNVGEVVLDALLCKKLKEVYPEKHITVVPASYPISSDATPKEAYEAGMADYADIVPNGNDIVGTYLPKCSKECIEVLDNADIIISKGMANFEVMSGSKYNVYYFFLCKCKFYCDALDAQMMQEMFISDKYSNVKARMKETWEVLGRDE